MWEWRCQVTISCVAHFLRASSLQCWSPLRGQIILVFWDVNKTRECVHAKLVNSHISWKIQPLRLLLCVMHTYSTSYWILELYCIWWRSKYIWGQNLSICQGMKVGHLPWLVYLLPCCILVHCYSINYETGKCPYIICSSMDKQMFVCFLIVSSHLSFICSLWISYYHQWTIVKTFCQHQLKKLLLRNLKKLDFFLFPRSKQYL